MDESRSNALAEQLARLEQQRVGGSLSDNEFQMIKTRLLEAEVGFAPEPQAEQFPRTPQQNIQGKLSEVVTAIGNLYRTVAWDVLIVFAFGFAGAAIVSIVFQFRLESTSAIYPLALSNVLSYTLGFSVVGMRARVEQYWRYLTYVALFAWLASAIYIVPLGFAITVWALSGIWIALATGMGGGIGLQLRVSPKGTVPFENSSEHRTWRKIPIRTQLISAGVATVILILGTSYIVYERAPKPQTAYSDLKLGMTMQQVKYVKGNNPSIVGEFQGASDQDIGQGGRPAHDSLTQRTMLLFDAISLPYGKHVEDYQMWAYASTDKHSILRVDFNPNTKKLIGISCISAAYSGTVFGIMSCQDLLGIQDRWTEKDLVKKLGNPTEEKMDGGIKILRYNDLGVQYFLAQEHVYMVSLFSVQ